MTKKNYEITGTMLKQIAVLTMFIDHFAVAVFKPWMNTLFLTEEAYRHYFIAYRAMRDIGRMAFPIYCYMLVEGFMHTRNLKKYAARLLFVAVLAEFPFDWALRRQTIDWTHNNVLWELLLGLIVITLMDFANKQQEGILSNEIFSRIIMVLIMFGGMAIGGLSGLDYGMAGIACIAVIYFQYGTDVRSRLIAFALGVLMLTLMSSRTEMFAFAMLVPMYFYHGNRGRDSKGIRLFFYLFYPCHLFLLYVVRFILL